MQNDMNESNSSGASLGIHQVIIVFLDLAGSKISQPDRSQAQAGDIYLQPTYIHHRLSDEPVAFYFPATLP